MQLNQQLKDLYYSNIPNAEKMASELGEEADYVAPLLMQCWENDYAAAKIKIVFCGQETNGWQGYVRPTTPQNIDEILAGYLQFNMGREYNSLFWQYVHGIHSEVNGDNNGFAWTNVLKFGKSDAGKPDSLVLSAELRYFNVLKDEIRILSPDFIVFLSGPNYDEDLSSRLRNLTFEQGSDCNVREFALLKSVYLPCPAIRTYHPGYLNRNPELSTKILSLISKQIQLLQSRK